MYVSRLLSSLSVINIFQARFEASVQDTAPRVTIGGHWSILGPWQIGTREAAWGVDPLEQFGGFHSLTPNCTAAFRSSLAFNATVSWSAVKARVKDSGISYAAADLAVSFDDVDWRFLQHVYGWAALQWQGWARGEFEIISTSPQRVTLYTDNVLEFWIDGQHFFGGDFYAFRNAPLSICVAPGRHQIDLRLIRDVRSMGGVSNPSIEIGLEIHVQDEELQHGSIVLPDAIADFDGVLASPYASVVLRNGASATVSIVDVESCESSCESELLSTSVIEIISGQSRPVSIRLRCTRHGTKAVKKVCLRFKYRLEGEARLRVVAVDKEVHTRSLTEPHKFTFPRTGGTVSYAVLRPPSKASVARCGLNASLPILLGLHGAGVDADSDLMRHALDDEPDLCAWVLYPTGSTPWSGDDWHTWGFADVEAAIAAVPTWIEQVHWEGPDVNINQWLVVGHSNGGQGTWYTLTHRPDKVIAAAPLSGYSSIQNYVPYVFSQVADPGRSAVAQAALQSWRHELLLQNAKGIPIMQQHGQADDNVPAYHSRLLSQKLLQAGAYSNFFEVPGRPHWWNGIMSTPNLKFFLERHLGMDSWNPTLGERAPAKLQSFSVVVANPGDMGPKHGVEVIWLIEPGQLGRVDIENDPVASTCVFYTSNVRRFALPLERYDCSLYFVDGQRFESPQTQNGSISFTNTNGAWETSTATFPPDDPKVRSPRQMGGLDAVLRTDSALQIVQHSKGKQAHQTALQISRNFCQYFFADTAVIQNYPETSSRPTNIVSVAVGLDLPRPHSTDHPIRLHSDFLLINDTVVNRLHRYEYGENGLAAIFLRPFGDGAVELAVWAAREDDLRLAARLVPLMTGTGQPDWIVISRGMMWKGLDGVLAMGWFDEYWRITRNSFFS